MVERWCAQPSLQQNVISCITESWEPTNMVAADPDQSVLVARYMWDSETPNIQLASLDNHQRI